MLVLNDHRIIHNFRCYLKCTLRPAVTTVLRKTAFIDFCTHGLNMICINLIRDYTFNKDLIYLPCDISLLRRFVTGVPIHQHQVTVEGSLNMEANSNLSPTIQDPESSEDIKYSDLSKEIDSGEGPTEPMTVDDVFELTGGMGVYQWGTFLLLGMISVFNVEAISMNFVGGQQDHWCHVEALSNLSYAQQKYIAIPKDSQGNYQQCRMFHLDYDSYTEEELLSWNRSEFPGDVIPLVECGHGWTYDKSQYVNTVTSRVSSYNCV